MEYLSLAFICGIVAGVVGHTILRKKITAVAEEAARLKIEVAAVAASQKLLRTAEDTAKALAAAINNRLDEIKKSS